MAWPRPLASLWLDASEASDGYPRLEQVWTVPDAGRIARFSPDGAHIACGSSNGTVKLMEVGPLGANSPAPATRTFAEGSKAINDVDFDPKSRMLITASDDCTIRFFDHRSDATKSARQCTDTHPVRSVSFHAAGDHLLVGTDHPAVHLYDVATFRCYMSAQAHDHHTAPVRAVRWLGDGSMYASCAAGEVKLWDGVASRCVRTWQAAHGGHAVRHVEFCAAEGRTPTLLTAGADGSAKLWDVGSGKLVRAIGASAPAGSAPACCVAHDGRHVAAAADAAGGFALWEAHAGDLVQRVGGAPLAGAPVVLSHLAHARGAPVVAACDVHDAMTLWAAPDTGGGEA